MGRFGVAGFVFAWDEITPHMYTILLYYKYVEIAEPEMFRKEHFDLCNELGLKGRIIVSREGINGTVEGTTENIRKYLAHMRADERFADIDFKESQGTGNAFPRLSVKVRPEIVTLGTGAVVGDPQRFAKGAYIEPDELQSWYDEGKDFVVVDMRNDYEQAVGHFEHSICMPVKNFREIPGAVKEIEHLKDKTVVSVCTGGVRCEKATNFLIEQGFSNVHQLHGGMVRYLEKHPGKKFKGSLYVFDSRVAVSFDSPDQHVVVGVCKRCRMPSERCVNCENLNCHEHFICCEVCSEDGVFCSDTCKEVVSAKAHA